MSDKPSRLRLKATGVVIIFGTVDIECDDETLIKPVGAMEVTPMLTLIQQTGKSVNNQDVPHLKRIIAHAMLNAAKVRLDQTVGVEVELPDAAPLTTDELSNLLRGGDPTAADLVLKRQGIVAQCEDCHDVDLRTCRYSTHWVCEECMTVLRELL